MEAILSSLAGKIGEVLTVEMRAIPAPKGDFHRVRVNLEAYKPLVRFVSLTPEGKETIMIQIKYEKIPRHCTHCGLMGHIFLECGTGEFADDELQFGEWMIAEETTWRPGTPRVRNPLGAGRGEQMAYRAGRTTARGRGGGRGQGGRGSVWKEKPSESGTSDGSRKRSSKEAGLYQGKNDDLEDTANSPLKPESDKKIQEDDLEVKKKLSFEQSPGVDVGGRIPPPPPAYVSPRDKKKYKKTEEGKMNSAAGSGTECRQEQ
jgi:hypothetical protein